MESKQKEEGLEKEFENVNEEEIVDDRSSLRRLADSIFYESN